MPRKRAEPVEQPEIDENEPMEDEENEEVENDEGDDEEISPEDEEYLRRQHMQQQMAHRMPQRGEASRYRPVANAQDVPLFPDSDKDVRNTVAYLRIIRQSKPKAGYKGQQPPNSTLENIALLYGNGVYTIEACAEDHTVLRRRQNVLISMDEANPHADNNKRVEGEDSISNLIRSTQSSHENEINRIHALTERATKQEADRGREYTTMVRETSKESREAMQLHYQTASKNQQDFFGALMAAQNMSFQQTMLIMNKSHDMQVQQMRENADRNNPMVYVQMMMQGLQMGRDMGGDDDNTPDWIKGMREGGEMLGNLLALKQGNPSMPQLQNPPEEQTEPAPRKRQPPGTTRDGRKIFEPDELRNMLELKETLRTQGIDLSEWLRQAKLSYHKESEAEHEPEPTTDDDAGEETPEEPTE
jgi:hypothetical protein